MSNRLIQNLFRSQAVHLANTKQPLKNRKAIDAIMHCRTRDMGVSYFQCRQGHEPIEQLHSCRHRSCFLCAQKQRYDWIEAQKQRLFNTAHFHVIFTLPHEYLTLWRYNERLMTALLFKASQRTLIDLLGEKKYQGITPGILMTLHTWGRQLTLHPHTHCLVTAGGLNSRNEWIDGNAYLLPIRVVKALYRGKFQAYLKAAFEGGELQLPPNQDALEFQRIYRRSYAKDWSVRIEDRYAHGKGVVLYLSRYLRGGPLHPDQIEHCSSRALSFRYWDHKRQRVQRLTLPLRDFVERLLWHVPAIGAHTVRYYGLYASSAKLKREHCQSHLGNLAGATPGITDWLRLMVLSCKVCGEPMRWSHSRGFRGCKGNSLRKEDRAGDIAQQIDAADLARRGYVDST